jgi:hypothetical protein
MAESIDKEPAAPAIVSRRTMEIVVSVALMAVAAVVMTVSYRLGAGWAADVGPDSGYFPFYVGLIMFAMSAMTLLQNVFARAGKRAEGFIARDQLIRVVQFLIPMTIFVVLSVYIGIYISTFLFLGFFMIWHGRYRLYKALPIAILVPIFLFIVFEIWFLVPLPKGPLEAWLGY